MKKTLILLILMVTSCHIQAQYSYDSTAIDKIRWSPKPSFVNGTASPGINLNNDWQFAIADSIAMGNTKNLDFKPIVVPGEWVMQGFEVKENQLGVYKKLFSIPKDWDSKQVKLRFEAVYSECEVWLNGQQIGAHYTGFTPFEFDISQQIKQGDNQLLVFIKGSSTADKLSSASKYAVHYLGGISRDVSVLALPKTNLASFHGSTKFDEEYVNATLKLETTLANESNTPSTVQLAFALKNKNGEVVKTFKSNHIDLGADSKEKIVTDVQIESPTKWNPEKPYVYTIEASLIKNGQVIEKTSKKIGFKQTEVRGNRVYVNNSPIKLRGVNRHEVHPKTGRVLRGNQWYEDVRIFKEGNVNYIRTSHYPPDERLLEACNELGMFVEVEAPFCWASKKHVTGQNYFNEILRPTLEMVEMLKSHPSILMWSLANESFDYKELFRESGKLVKLADPSRPRIFSQWGPDADEGDLEITNHHYPGTLDKVDSYKNYKRPITFDEFMHLNAYNRKELATDPGVRDYWGTLFFDMWEKMYKTPAVLGGAIWAGIDDSFMLPTGEAVGYGTWGPIDGWRRKKPEFWHMKKVYSPIKITLDKVSEKEITLQIENRNMFTNCNEYNITWKTADENGVLNVDIEALSKGEATIATERPFTQIDVEVQGLQGKYSIDSYHFDIASNPKVVFHSKKGRLKTEDKNRTITISDGNIKYSINKTTGLFNVLNATNTPLLTKLPELLMLPITGDGGGTQMTKKTPDFDIYSDVCNNRIIKNIEIISERDKVVLKIDDTYQEAIGYQKITIFSGGKIDIEYTYTVQGEINPRQVGLVFQLPKEYSRLNWERKGLWSVYPEDHIGRLKGTAITDKTVKTSGLAGPYDKPEKDYLFDRTKSGSNDFRSTKQGILFASLANQKGNLFQVDSHGSHSVRAWESDVSVKVLVAEYNNPGGEGFLRSHGSALDKKLSRGSRIKGGFTIKIK